MSSDPFIVPEELVDATNTMLDKEGSDFRFALLASGRVEVVQIGDDTTMCVLPPALAHTLIARAPTKHLQRILSELSDVLDARERTGFERGERAGRANEQHHIHAVLGVHEIQETIQHGFEYLALEIRTAARESSR